LKRDGKIGETWEGYLDIVDGESLSARQRAVFDEENNIRRDSYQHQATKSDTSPSEEAQRAGERNIAQAAPGEYIKDRSGRWERKK
ncbi:MAG: YdbL family protein, partial [Phycisphaerales bacterium]|nr:YdbL family protein [Phycisphaerales bacterium]